MADFPRITLIIPTTGDPRVLEPLFDSIIKNTVGSYSVVILKQRTKHPAADYKKWKSMYKNWLFLDGTDNMILTARNTGILETYIPVNLPQGNQWFAEMDDDVILPPRWDEDMIKAAELKEDGVIFVPLIPFPFDMYYKDQVAVLPSRIWQSLFRNDLAELNAFYSEYVQVEEPKLKSCILPEYTFILRRNNISFPTTHFLWDTAFDVVRNASHANEDLMIRVKKYGASAYVVQSVMIFHRNLQRDIVHPRRYYAAADLRNYLTEKWPEYKLQFIKSALVTPGQAVKLEDAKINMAKGVPPNSVANRGA